MTLLCGRILKHEPRCSLSTILQGHSSSLIYNTAPSYTYLSLHRLQENVFKQKTNQPRWETNIITIANTMAHPPSTAPPPVDVHRGPGPK